MASMKRRYSVLLSAVIVIALVAVVVTRLVGEPARPQSNEAPPAAAAEPTAEPAAEPATEPATAAAAGRAAAGTPPAATSASAAPSTPTHTLAPETSLTLTGGVVTLQVPADLSLAVAGEPLLATSTIPPCDEGFDYCLYLPQGSYAGTNFRAAGTAIKLRADLTSQTSCLLAQPSGYQSLQPGLVVEPEGPDAASTARFAGLMDGAAGTYANGELRRLYVAGSCYEFTSRVVESQFGNYPTGTITEFTAADRQTVLGHLSDALERVSLKLPSGTRSVTWPASGTSDLAPFIRLATPRPGASVTSPLQLSGEAVGQWYFEGSFPVTVVAEDGTVIGQGSVSAQGDWMTTDLVPFEGEVAFEAGDRGGAATIVLARDNPSDLPQNDAALHVPVLLAQ